MDSQKAQTPETQVAVKKWDERRKVDILYSPPAAVLINFPMTKPHSTDASPHIYERNNGDFYLKIIADPNFGMPFGQDQLFLQAVLDEAVGSASPVVPIGSIYKILKSLGMPTSGPKYQLVRQTILRVFGSSATYWYQEGNGVTGERFLYFKKVHLEILKDKYGYCEADGDYIVLSDELYSEAMKHRIPFDLEMIRRLKKSVGATRLYIWVAQRAFRIKSKNGSIFVLFEQLANDLGSDISSNPRAFKQNLLGWVDKVNQELQATNGDLLKLEVDSSSGGLKLYKQTVVPGNHRRKAIEFRMPKAPKSPKGKSPKEFDIDWVLEQEFEDWRDGKIPALSEAANSYLSEKRTAMGESV